MRREHFGRNARLVAGFAQDPGVGAALQYDTRQRHLESGHALDTGGKRIDVNAVAAAQKRAVDIEKVGILLVPHETRLDRNSWLNCRKNAGFCCFWLHGLRDGQPCR